jgi:ATP-dependent RNA helicase DDX27
MAMEEDNEMAKDAGVKAAIRSAKKSARPTKIGVPQPTPPQRKKTKEKRRSKVTFRATGSTFDRDLGQTLGRGEGVRAKKGDTVAGMVRKGGKRKRN